MNLPIIIIIIILKILLIFPSLHFFYGCLLFFSSNSNSIYDFYNFFFITKTNLNQFFFLFSALTSWDDQWWWWWWWWSGNHHQGMQSPHLPFQFSLSLSLFSHTFFQRSFKVFITIIIIFDDQSSIWFDLIDSMIFDVANLSFFLERSFSLSSLFSIYFIYQFGHLDEIFMSVFFWLKKHSKLN